MGIELGGIAKPVSIVNQDPNKLFPKFSESKINKQEVFLLLWNNTDFPDMIDPLLSWNEWQKILFEFKFFFLLFLSQTHTQNTSLPSSVCST